ncbi:DUF72 domain-containing protein [Salipaludibacillus sp. HK11]|uniref:DUF72 domain-containing protein n=1 Tax=Salipaludibacillus sp. HK11 TaxID=3394320 RepID=UPI0039FBF999
MMIKVGLLSSTLVDRENTNWKNRFKKYSKNFSIIELDSTFYAIKTKENYIRSVDETPDNFNFIVRAYQGMTGDRRYNSQFSGQTDMYDAFKESVKYVASKNKLKAVLFQYPSWFDCNNRNVNLLRETKERMNNIPSALELNHHSWFSPNICDRTMSFIKREGWIHSISDKFNEQEINELFSIIQLTNVQHLIVHSHGYDCINDLLKLRDKLEILKKKTSEINVIFSTDFSIGAKELIELTK